MKIYFIFLLLSFNLYCQDTIIDKGSYKSYFSYILKEPLYVKYILHKGGGNCKRNDKWVNDTKISMVSKEYKGLGYDKGHLANAEDFAYDCILEDKTFRYYNCLPQTPNLNRGIWKTWEATIRKESQTDSLLIITGGIWTSKIKHKNIPIPDECWKVVYSLKSKKLNHVLLFTNSKSNSTVNEITLEKLENKLGYKINLVF